jgi:hypothetical protein
MSQCEERAVTEEETAFLLLSDIGLYSQDLLELWGYAVLS